jgi:hypothetical protein
MVEYINKYESRGVVITTSQMELIHSLKNKSDKIIAFTFIYMSYIFKDEQDEFDCSNKTLQHLTGLGKVNTIKVMDLLIEQNYITCIYRDKLKVVEASNRKYKVNKCKNRFKLNSLASNNDNIIYEFKYIDTKTNNILKDFYKCYLKYLIDNKIKIPRRTKEQILKYVG